ncbi:squalene/phytoene synthase family protein, partial [Caldalkalibacillus mannanilyticus]|uniref:squalene/phytoene synthase family protein n=1 Tax=Caldalkalibacillus mannanilyticus TaxID=1418 RepID=UPI00131F1D4A
MMTNNLADLQKEAMEMLLATSRTFFIPISHLSQGVQEAVASAYLCMRAIDEIEDHPHLPSDKKAFLLREIAKILPNGFEEADFNTLFQEYTDILPEVTLRLSDWAKLCPETIAPTVYQSTSVMANGMADWVEKNWQIENEADLDSYT